MKAGTAAAVLASAIAVIALAPATDASGTCDTGGASGGTGATGSGCDTGRDIKPFRHQRWDAGGVDMGVDYMPKHRHPLRGIGKAKGIGADNPSGWPRGPLNREKPPGGDP